MNKYLIAVAVVALSGPGFAVDAETGGDEMRNMTSSVLAGITGTAPKVEDQDGEVALSALVEQALSQGQSDAYLEALVAEAAESGMIQVPQAMMDTTGHVDTKVLLASLVEKSLAPESQSGFVKELETEANGKPSVNAQNDPVYHVVAEGESLAAIAKDYYDSALAYSRIFDANRDVLKTADRIYVGQKLLIP